jgi:hypothetical protein
VNEQEYRKQLLVQQIQSHRERMTMEVELLKESNPMTPVFRFVRALTGVWNAVSPGVAALTGGSSARGKFPGLGLSFVLPGLVQIVASLLSRKRQRRQ